ncbi:ankyrin repeat domain-containing protein [Belliella pelovolcani]|uniref:Ankyrin repeat-containing protein n=1 Tax=Belliella pelovolcani TaxID=529505 RepID=A0A1N7Q3A1_9BACT|nr:ankyrin repeat domain-containing protein [Belliella pelovolcani]SIT17364.1 Ankyrin repeat-containing protein [Belliella pelovolcani]
MNKKFDKAKSFLYKNDFVSFAEIIVGFENLNFVDKDGRTLLIYTILENNKLFTEFLINNGVNINLADKNGWSPLHFSVNENLIELVHILLENGAEVNSQDNFGNTVLWRAVFSSEGKGEVIEKLLKYGADPEMKNNYGISALDLANTIDNYNVKQFFKK